MAAKLWKIALGVACGVVVLTIGAVVLLPLGFWWLETAMQRQAAEPLTAIEILECELVRDDGSIAVRGSVLNGGKGMVRDVRVNLRWTDGSGSVIEEDLVHTAGVGGVAPGGRSGFERLREDPGGKIHGVRCLIDCVSTEQALVCR